MTTKAGIDRVTHERFDAPKQLREESTSRNTKSAVSALLNAELLKQALIDSFKKLAPHIQWRNPVMFVVYVGSLLTTVLYIQALTGKGEAPAGFILAVTLWLWFTVLFANFAEAIAEGRSKATVAALRAARREIQAKKLTPSRAMAPSMPWHRPRACAGAMSSWSRPGTTSPGMARSSRGWPPWMRAPSPGRARR